MIQVLTQIFVIDVLMVAIGADGAEFVELTKIASQPHSRHVHRVPDYEGLADIVDNVVANACTEARGSYVERCELQELDVRQQ